MTDHLSQPAHHAMDDTRFMLLAGIAFLMTVGITFGVFGFTYVRDIETLSNLPNLIWNFACGRPESNEVTLPLLMTLSILCFLASAAMQGARVWLKQQGKRKAKET